MIRQQPGDLLEIQFEGQHFYLIVLTKIAMFGGNIVFAFHGDGLPKEPNDLGPQQNGFNICTDLLTPKKEGTVERIKTIQDTSPYWRTRLAKGAHEHRPGHKAKEWFIYPMDDLLNHIDRTATMSEEYKRAMDRALYSFDLTVQKILNGYTPEQNPHL